MKKLSKLLMIIMVGVFMLPVATGHASAESQKQCFLAKGMAKSTSVRYSWTPVNGAVKYTVFCSKCGENRYKRAKTTSGLFCEKKNLIYSSGIRINL